MYNLSKLILIIDDGSSHAHRKIASLKMSANSVLSKSKLENCCITEFFIFVLLLDISSLIMDSLSDIGGTGKSP